MPSTVSRRQQCPVTDGDPRTFVLSGKACHRRLPKHLPQSGEGMPFARAKSRPTRTPSTSPMSSSCSPRGRVELELREEVVDRARTDWLYCQEPVPALREREDDATDSMRVGGGKCEVYRGCA